MHKDKNTSSKTLTVKQAAERLNMNEQIVRFLIRKGKIKAEKKNSHQLLISVEEIEAYEDLQAALEKESEKYSHYLTLEEASEIHGTGPINLYSSIRKGTLLAYTDPRTKKHRISREELARYTKAKTSVAHKRFHGELLCDKSKGEYLFSEVAEMLGLDYIDLFYEIKSPTCSLKYKKRGKYKIVHIDDLKKYQKLLEEKRKESTELK